MSTNQQYNTPYSTPQRGWVQAPPHTPAPTPYFPNGPPPTPMPMPMPIVPNPYNCMEQLVHMDTAAEATLRIIYDVARRAEFDSRVLSHSVQVQSTALATLRNGIDNLDKAMQARMPTVEESIRHHKAMLDEHHNMLKKWEQEKKLYEFFKENGLEFARAHHADLVSVVEGERPKKLTADFMKYRFEVKDVNLVTAEVAKVAQIMYLKDYADIQQLSHEEKIAMLEFLSTRQFSLNPGFKTTICAFQAEGVLPLSFATDTICGSKCHSDETLSALLGIYLGTLDLSMVPADSVFSLPTSRSKYKSCWIQNSTEAPTASQEVNAFDGSYAENDGHGPPFHHHQFDSPDIKDDGGLFTQGTASGPPFAPPGEDAGFFKAATTLFWLFVGVVSLVAADLYPSTPLLVKAFIIMAPLSIVLGVDHFLVEAAVVTFRRLAWAYETVLDTLFPQDLSSRSTDEMSE